MGEIPKSISFTREEREERCAALVWALAVRLEKRSLLELRDLLVALNEATAEARSARLQQRFAYRRELALRALERREVESLVAGATT